jgi:DNA-binding transcriptional LysR family regulator
MLNLGRLQLLREVSRRGTIAAAAGAMQLTPSAVSQQLAALERETGSKLLERVGRSVRLTDAGRLLVRHADIIATAVAEAEAELAGMREAVTGDFRFSAFPTAARAVMPSVLAALSQRYPDLRLSLRDLEAAESVAALRLGEVDIAIVDEYEGMALPGESAYERHDVLRDPVYIAFPPDRPDSQAPVGLWDLRDEHWIMDAENSRFFEMTLLACRRAGFEPHIRSQCRDFSVIVALVEAGIGIAALPGLALHDRQVRAMIRPTNPPLTRNVVAAISPDRRAHPAVADTFTVPERFGRSWHPSFATPRSG